MSASTVPLRLRRTPEPAQPDPLAELHQLLNECRIARGLPPLTRADWIKRIAPEETTTP